MFCELVQKEIRVLVSLRIEANVVLLTAIKVLPHVTSRTLINFSFEQYRYYIYPNFQNLKYCM